MKIEGLPVIEVDESEEITVAVRADDVITSCWSHSKGVAAAVDRTSSH